MKGLSLFTGVGGIDLAAEAAGIEVAAMCEIEPFCVGILNKRWPGIPVFDDVRKINGDTIRDATGGAVDIVYGGFPCQDLSAARQDIQNRRGLEGARSGLWFEMARVIRELRPLWVLAENVRGAVDLALDTVTENLEAAGYEVRSLVLPASASGAPHQRERLFVCGARKDVADACGQRLGCAGGLQDYPREGTEPFGKWIKIHGLQHRTLGERRGDDGETAGQLNPDWVEQLMCFPEGWTDPGRDRLGAWQGFPAKARLKASARASGRIECPQYPYEFPRLLPEREWRKERLRALGNAVVPLQAWPLFQAMATMHRAIFGGGDDNSGGCGDI